MCKFIVTELSTTFGNIIAFRFKSQKSIVSRQRKLRKHGSTPPPFPNGWFVIAESQDVSLKLYGYMMTISNTTVTLCSSPYFAHFSLMITG